VSVVRGVRGGKANHVRVRARAGFHIARTWLLRFHAVTRHRTHAGDERDHPSVQMRGRFVYTVVAEVGEAYGTERRRVQTGMARGAYSHSARLPPPSSVRVCGRVRVYVVCVFAHGGFDHFCTPWVFYRTLYELIFP
jgi:hypothetical protein